MQNTVDQPYIKIMELKNFCLRVIKTVLKWPIKKGMIAVTNVTYF